MGGRKKRGGGGVEREGSERGGSGDCFRRFVADSNIGHLRKDICGLFG
jgi:hypothetical protein